jgi:photosystem II stability/assembly factor-like uncharacterized protein
MSDLPSGAPASLRQGLVYLALAALLAAIVLATMHWPATGSSAGATCDAGTAVDRLSIARDAGGGSHLLAIVGPASGLNVAVGNEPGCQALYQSGDGGATWTAVFSHSSEAPISLVGDTTGHLYLLATTVRFPIYLAGNMYRNDDLSQPWTWVRVSPQQRAAVPTVAISDIGVMADGSIVALAANGDGGAIVRSIDLGTTWQPILVPGLSSVSGMALLDNSIAVANTGYAAGKSPGRTSIDSGRTWQTMGLLPNAPARKGLKPVLTAVPIEDALVLDLVSGTAASSDPPVATYVSRNDGRTWSTVHCGALPSAGCAGIDRWSQTANARYVLYRRRLFRSQSDLGWQPMPAALPVDAGTIEQVLAAPHGQNDDIYLVTPTAIWRTGPRGTWASITEHLALPAAPAPLYTSLPPGWPAAT